MNRKLSKRGKLFLANGIAFIVLVIFFIFITLMNHDVFDVTNVFIFLLIQCAFTFLSLIVYYLSIIADALNKKYVRIEEDKHKKL